MTASLVLTVSGQNREPTSLDGNLKRNHSSPIRTGPLGGCSDIAERVSPSIVTIFTTKTVASRTPLPRMDLFDDPFFKRFFGHEGFEKRDMPVPKVKGLGSGVIITSDGYIVTNSHVVEGADEINVRLPGNKKDHVASVVGSDTATDIAVLKIEATDLVGAQLGDSDKLRVGDTVIAIGNPFGLSHTVTMGIVSALGRNDLNITGYENFIQTDASINIGNSGGALVDNNGSIIGINTAILSGGTGGNVGIGFAIPINMVVDIAKQLVSDGSIRRGYLGVMLSDVTESLAKAFGVEARGALVNEVLSNSPAERSGIQPGDIIVEYGEDEIEDVAGLRLLVAKTAPNEDVDCVVLRDGKREAINVKTGQLSESAIARQGRLPSSQIEEFLPDISVEELTAENQKRWEINDSLHGVVVTKIGPKAPVAQGQLNQGDVIVEVNRTKVKTVRQALQARDEAPKDVLLLRVWDEGRVRYLAVETN